MAWVRAFRPPLALMDVCRKPGMSVTAYARSSALRVSPPQSEKPVFIASKFCGLRPTQACAAAPS